MADKKISALTGASTPLAGTEVLPIVQSGATVKVAVDNLTVKNIRANATSGILQVTGPAAASTRVATVPDANFTVARTDAAQSFTGDQTLATGNLVIGTSGKGIDFSATPGTGTSELFADYEEGTWTPSDSSGASLVYTVADGVYTKIGRLVEASFAIVFPATVSAAAIRIGGLPFTSKNVTQSMYAVSFSVVQYTVPITCVVDTNAATFLPLTYGAATVTNASMSGLILRGTAIYEV
jgi:hypothetical protein